MAERRMFSRKITNHDNFTSLSAAAQALYMHLMMDADDDGFCDRTNIALSNAHARKKDLDALVDRHYVIKFDSGIYAIKHWRMQNSIRTDRYTPTEYQEEFTQLTVKKNGAYAMPTWQPDGNHVTTKVTPDGCQDDNQTATKCQPLVANPQPQVRYRLGKVSNTGDMCLNARAREEESDDGFEAFWDSYPRKVGGSIREAYVEYLHVTEDLGVNPGILIAAAIEQGRELTKETARYFPGADKWLRNRGWEQKKPKAKDGETNNIFLEIYNEEHGE